MTDTTSGTIPSEFITIPVAELESYLDVMDWQQAKIDELLEVIEVRDDMAQEASDCPVPVVKFALFLATGAVIGMIVD